jgi:S-DNA-T family DNA segregation ATPase FtsK/SpoIIIE
LILERGRVAVSMLVREYGLDFKQATAVLDELQSQGLIGPYLGGQSRDILLTAEEWRAKTGALS